MVTQKFILDENIISTDAGNGWAAVYRFARGKVRQHGIPHARARVSGNILKSDLGAQNVADYADFCGQRYGYGDGIWNLTDAPIDTHQNTARRYGEGMHTFLILVNIASMGVKSGSELSLIVPAPPGLLNEVKPNIQSRLLAGENGDGIWRIQLRTDKKPREYKFKRVIVVPEGAGAFSAYRLNIDGTTADMRDSNGVDVLSGRVVVLDLGAGTGDTYTLVNGNVAPDAIQHATDDRAGVIHNLLRPILGDVLAIVPEARSYLTTAHIDAMLRRYISDPRPENAVMRLSGRNVDVERSILANAERYGEWISTNKLDPIFAAGADALLMAGGGWLYIGSWMRQWYPNRFILSPEMFKHTRNVAIWDLNGVGQLALAAAVLGG